MRRALWALLACLLVLGSAPAPSRARAPVVTVKARTIIRVDPPSRTSFGAAITGIVEDAASGEPVPQVRLVLGVSGRQVAVTTDEDGRFRVDLDLATGRHDLVIDYEGDRSFTAAHYELLDFELDRQLVTLSLSVTPAIAADGEAPAAYDIVVRAAADDAPVAIVADLTLDTGQPQPLRLGPLATDTLGRGVLAISNSSLGGAGRKRITAAFSGTERQHPASAEVIFLVTAATELRMAKPPASVGFDDEFRAAGTVSEAGAGPLPGIPVALLDGERRLAATLTREDGSFRLVVDGDELGSGRHTLEIAAEPVPDWLLASHSAPFAVEVGEPTPIPIGYMLAASMFTLLGLLGFFALRSRPWERLRRKKTAERNQRDATDAAAPPRGGLRPKRVSMVATLRPADRRSFSGTVRDATTQRRLPAATLQAREGAAIAANAQGEFAIDDLFEGTSEFIVACRGYLAERVAVTAPHRGEFDEVTVSLVSIREHVFALYRGVAQGWLPSVDHWGIWTPRQIFEHVRGRQPSGDLAVLTAFVEETYFSARVPQDEAITRAGALLSAAKTEAARAAEPATPASGA